LAELTSSELRNMLGLDETLFVEHKRDIRNESVYQLAKAVSAFANTLGGWVLLGVRDGRPDGEDHPWAADGAPTLVDAMRDRLRGEIDPLPAFEARVMTADGLDGNIGVVRVYESADTPHVSIRTGSVFVRETAGDADVARTPREASGAPQAQKRRYEASQIRNRTQLLELAHRGALAMERANQLLDCRTHQPTGLEQRLGLFPQRFADKSMMTGMPENYGAIFARAVPLTGSDRFRAWATTADGAAATMSSCENLADTHGLVNDFAKPEIAGVSVAVGPVQRDHRDNLGMPLLTEGRVAIDADGIAGAALYLQGPTYGPGLTTRLGVLQFADALIVRVVNAAVQPLEDGGFLGRVRLQIDLVETGIFVALEDQLARPQDIVSVVGDVTLPIESDEAIDVARLASTAAGRSAGLPTWNHPPSMH
jgi:hypothetical protein